MLQIGPHQFSDEDVISTLRAGPALFDLVTDGLRADAVAAVSPHRDRALDVLDDRAEDHAVALATFWLEWRAAMAAVRATGALGPSDVATVTGLFRSDGGVPKLPVEHLVVSHGGVVGDRQEDRHNHGRPWQGLCMWSTDVIDDFRRLGHPLAPGLAGENISITGLSWPRVRPGVLLRLGDVLAEVTAYAVPCQKNAAWFVDGRFDAMHHRHGPVSRIYALVLEPGTINVGDPVLMETTGSA